MPHAALDIGSNTVRLLVAIPWDGSLIPLADKSEFVRLGLDVDRTGELRADREEAAVAAIRRMKETATRLGAAEPPAIATSAVRDAGNGPAFVERVRRETGIAVRIINGEEEAGLTYLGATLGLTIEGTTIVVDLGGGSAEIVAADERDVLWARSLPLGSGRLTERFIHHDPPHAEEVQHLQAHVEGLLRELPATRARRAILTGGTATRVVRLAGKNGTTIELSPNELTGVLTIVETESAEAIVARGLNSARVAVLPAGVAALAEIICFYGIEQITITMHGIREGVIEATIRHVLGF